ncbi:MAG: DNA-deoxyinosine glycosylase [Proteobacteria bacterium]|nr:DNA-deoxyinosine glycosylase [Pseudomonadota bacterium]
MAVSQGFSPVADPSARVLVLGSLPGKASLAAQAYYANRQNAFWRIMGDLFGAVPDLPYEKRLEKLKAAGVALWDVIAAGERPGSLDADIVRTSICINDFSAFFAVHREIRAVCFNGAAAEAMFRRHVLPMLQGMDVQFIRLPSTSPAHAGIRYEEKLAAWSVLVALLRN